MADYATLSNADLAERKESIRSQVEALAGIDNPTEGQRERFENLSAAFDRIEAEESARAELLEARAQRRALAMESVKAGRTEPGFGGIDVITRTNRDPHAGLDGQSFRMMNDRDVVSRAEDSIDKAPEQLPAASREMLQRMLERPRSGRDAAEFILVGSNPHYRTAFEKVLADPIHGHRLWSREELAAFQAVQSSRAAMSLTDGNGGYLVPQLLDPSVILTNAGSVNPFRQISRVERGTSDVFNGVTSAGVSAEWLAEGAEVADATPTFTSAAITAHKAAAYVFGSYEVLGDTNIEQQLPGILMDAKDRLEAAAFVTGSGSNAPFGVVSRVAAVTASVVDPTTAGTFTTASVADVYKVDEALTDRARTSGSSAWVADRAIGNIIRQMDTSGGSSFWANLGEAMPEQLLGRPYYESSAMDSAITTGSDILLAGDFSQYLIYDRLGMTLVYDPVVLGSNRRPTGQGGWFAYWRVGADVTDAGAFRVLTL